MASADDAQQGRNMSIPGSIVLGAHGEASLISKITSRLLRPIDAAWLAAFRLLYGLALAISMLRFLAYGWVERFFVQPKFHFKYLGFEWVEPLSASGMRGLFVALFLLALAVALGFAFRVTAPVFALCLFYFQLIDVSTYLNHYYLAALLALLLSVSPAHRCWSVDAWIARRFSGSRSPNERDASEFARTRICEASESQIATAWLWLFRFQIGVVYVFAGLAKAQADWLIHAQPLRIWLSPSTSLPVLGWLFSWQHTPLVLSWCGFLFDTTIVLFLLHRRSRIWAYAAVVGFHALTRLLFPIGMFPVIMIVSALVFFPANWPRQVAERLRILAVGKPKPSSDPARALAKFPSEVSMASASGHWRNFCLLMGAAYCAVQVLLPARSLVYPGNVLWHEQGMRFSWRVMLRAKGGSTTFLVRQEPTGRVFHVSPRTYLTGLQESEMSSQPDLILQLAHHIARDFGRRGMGPVSVRAESRASLNGRRSAALIDPKLDLVRQRAGLGRANFVLPAPSAPPPQTQSVL